MRSNANTDTTEVVDSQAKAPRVQLWTEAGILHKQHLLKANIKKIEKGTLIDNLNGIKKP